LSSGIATPPMVCVRTSAEERRGMMSAAGRLSAERARDESSRMNVREKSLTTRALIR
jgi:hypothetical protein